MTLGEKLSKLRKENSYTQEQLADVLGVSRQAISKWESGAAYPETEKLIRISTLFDCSLDYLLKDGEETADERQPAPAQSFFRQRLHERKSARTVGGLPLWHIARNARGILAIGMNARGIVAIGLKARGILSFGVLSAGLLSFGLLSLGLLSAGLFTLGIFSAGCFAAGLFTTGAVTLGVIALGAVAVGDFSAGALAIGKYAAIGDHAKAMIAVGDTWAAGSVFQKTGSLTVQDAAYIKQLLGTVVPSRLSWAAEIFKLMI